jgi:hypothetical protein
VVVHPVVASWRVRRWVLLWSSCCLSLLGQCQDGAVVQRLDRATEANANTCGREQLRLPNTHTEKGSRFGDADPVTAVLTSTA